MAKKVEAKQVQKEVQPVNTEAANDMPAKPVAAKPTAEDKAHAKEAAVLNKRSKEIIARVEKTGAEIQSHLVALAKHIMQHRNGTMLSHFIAGLERVSNGKSFPIARVDAIRAWATEFAFFSHKMEKDTGAYKIKMTLDRLDEMSDEERVAHVLRMESTNWASFKADPTFIPFDLEKRVRSLIQQANEKAMEAREGKPHKIDADLLMKLKALI